MEIYARVKAIGKRRDILAPTPYPLPDEIRSLRMFLTAVVQKEVALYNSKEADGQPLVLLTPQQLDDLAESGKVGFGRVWSDQKADPAKAIANAIQCWEDGLVRVFMDDEELTQLDAPLVIPDGAVFTFIRLTFLAGSMW